MLHKQAPVIKVKYNVLADPKFFTEPGIMKQAREVYSRLVEFNPNCRIFLPINSAAPTLEDPFYSQENIRFFQFSRDYNLHTPINFSNPVPWIGQNVFQVAIMAAAHLGCNPIYLVGLDHAGSLREKMVEISHCFEKPHILDKPQMSQEEWDICKFKMVNQLYELIRYLDYHGIKVFNTYHQSMLKSFPYRRFSSIFREDILRLARKAAAAHNQNDDTGADKLLKRIETYCEYPENLFLLKSKVCRKLGRTEEALAACRKELDCYPGNQAAVRYLQQFNISH